MTSANVVNYRIFDRATGKQVGEHSEHALCVSRWTRLLGFHPLKMHDIQPWGYDEEEELWEGEKQNLAIYLKGKIRAAQTIFVVKVYEEMELSSPCRNIGWWLSQEEAFQGLQAFGDECRYSYAIIEELGYGLHPTTVSAKWYFCGHNTKWSLLKDANQFELVKCCNHTIG